MSTSISIDPKTYNFSSEDDTLSFARDFAGTVEPGDIILLEGDLGAGKTAFARAVIQKLNNNPDMAVPSPTFTLVQTYDSPKMEIWHFDLYRLGDPEEIFEIGWEEALSGPLVLVEWPDRLGPYKPENAITISLETTGNSPDARILTIKQAIKQD